MQTIANGTIGLACLGAAMVSHDPMLIVVGPILMINAGWSCANIGLTNRASTMLAYVEKLEKKRHAPIKLLMEQ